MKITKKMNKKKIKIVIQDLIQKLQELIKTKIIKMKFKVLKLELRFVFIMIKNYNLFFHKMK